MRGLLLISFTAATAFATATIFAPQPAQAIITPTGLSAAIQHSDVRQNVYWRRRAYRPYVYWPYAYSYAYRPYAYSYAYRPYHYYRPAWRLRGRALRPRWWLL
jgi:hypothetical protein